MRGDQPSWLCLCDPEPGIHAPTLLLRSGRSLYLHPSLSEPLWTTHHSGPPCSPVTAAGRPPRSLPPSPPHLQEAEITALSSVLLKHRLASCLVPLGLFHSGRLLPRKRLLVLPGQEEQELCLIHSRCPRRAQKRAGRLKGAPSVPVELNQINLILRHH